MNHNPVCVTNDCKECKGRGFIELWKGNPPVKDFISCPGEEALKSLHKECRVHDSAIHRLFIQGLPIPNILSSLSLQCSLQALQRYISMRRKIEPARWPYRRVPNNWGAKR